MITHERSGHRGAFVWLEGEKRLAELAYTLAGRRAILEHTEVDDALRGQGAGKKLVAAAVEWARAENVLLLPLCPFARSVFERTAEFADVFDR